MEKKLLKKDKLSGIVKKLAAEKTVYAPVKDEDNVLFKILEPGMEPLTSFANTKNAPKKVFFPHSELLMKYTRSPKGMVFAAMPADAEEFVLFGARPCDARSVALLDMLFDQEKWKDPYYIEKRKKGTVISLACVHPPYSTCFCTSVDGSPTSTQGADLMLTDLGENYLVEFLTPKGEALAPWFGEATAADAAAEAKKQAIAEQSAAEIKKKIPGRAIKPILDVSFEHPFWDTIAGKCLSLIHI